MIKKNDKFFFEFLLFVFGWGWKSKDVKKMSLYKFTYKPLSKNDIQLEQKNGKQPTPNQKIKTITNFIKK